MTKPRQVAGRAYAERTHTRSQGEGVPASVLGRDWSVPTFFGSAGPSFSRASLGWWTGANGKTVAQFANDNARRDSRGLLINGAARQRLTQYPTTPGNWATVSATQTVQAVDSSFTSTRVFSSGTVSSFIQAAVFSAAAGDKLSVRGLYKASSVSPSGRVMFRVRSSTANLNGAVSGPTGNLTATDVTLGAITNLRNIDYGDGLFGIEFTVTLNSTQTDFRLSASPNSATNGEAVDIYGGQAVIEPVPGEWILGTETSQVIVAAETQTENVSALAIKSFLATFQLRGWGTGVTEAVICQIDDGTENNRVRLAVTTSTLALHAVVTAGGVDVADLILGTILLNTDYAADISWSDNSFIGQLLGNAAVADTSGAAPTGLTTLREAKSTAGNSAVVLLHKQQFWDKALTVSQLAGALAAAANPFDAEFYAVDLSSIIVGDSVANNAQDQFLLNGNWYSFNCPKITEPFAPIRRSPVVENLLWSEQREGYQFFGDIGRDRIRTEIRSRVAINTAQELWVTFAARCFGVANLSSVTSDTIFQALGSIDTPDGISETSIVARVDLRSNRTSFSTGGAAGPYDGPAVTDTRYIGPPMVDGRWELFLLRVKPGFGNGEANFWRGTIASGLQPVVSQTGLTIGFDYQNPPKPKFGCYGPGIGVPQFSIQHANVFWGTDLGWVLTRPYPVPNII